VLPPPPLGAAPEALPLDIVYEDDHLMVINKVGCWKLGVGQRLFGEALCCASRCHYTDAT
jgi:23S rRNA-/tRNA-specific pseudouridylate synthase